MSASTFMIRVKKALAALAGKEVNNKSLATTKDGALFDIYGREILDGSDYFHPNQVRGIPVFSVETLMEQHKGYIKRIVKNCGVGDHHRTEDGLVLNDELYVAVIRRYIEYVHLLPASESHHHCVPGGLLIHSFEVSEIAYSVADDMKPATTGMLDVDKRLEPSYKYAAWLGGLLHDAGKVVADMTIHAVSIYDEATQSNIKVQGKIDIPVWQPERESLISWARRYSVATYSVTFKKDRIHNQHNFDTSVLFSPIIGNGAALDKILTKPVNIRNELTKVLSGFESKNEYLKKSIRVADNKSTGENLKIYQHLKMGPGKLSNAAMVYRAIQWSRPKWLINKPNGHAWVIGDDVYLRYTSAFDVIHREAEENGYHVAVKGQGLLEVMADNDMVERYSEESWSVKYTGGVFTESDIDDIRLGRKTVGWESVVKVIWRGVVFGEDPVPDSAPGIMLLPDDGTMILVKTDGSTKEFLAPVTRDVNEPSTPAVDERKSNVSKEQPRQPVVIDNDIEHDKNKKETSSTDAKSVKSIAAPAKETAEAKENSKAIEPTKTKPSRKKLKFKNEPANKKVQDFKPTNQQSATGQSLPQEVVEFWEKAVFVKNPPRGSYFVDLNKSAESFAMTREDLATKAREDGVIVPNPKAPMKVVTIHNNEPCLHISISPKIVVKKSKSKTKKIGFTDKAVAPVEAVFHLPEEENNNTVIDVNQDTSIWENAKKHEVDCGLRMIVGGIKNMRCMAYAVSLVIENKSNNGCVIQLDEGLLVNAGLFAGAIRGVGEYSTQARTVHAALVGAGIELVWGCNELYLVPYAELKNITIRLR